VPRGNAAEAHGGRPTDRVRTDALRETTLLRRKSKESIATVHIDEVASEGVLLFYFPNDADPISLDDKEVVFRTRLGPLEVKVHRKGDAVPGQAGALRPESELRLAFVVHVPQTKLLFHDLTADAGLKFDGISDFEAQRKPEHDRLLDFLGARE